MRRRSTSGSGLFGFLGSGFVQIFGKSGSARLYKSKDTSQNDFGTVKIF